MKKNFIVTTGLIDTWEFYENNFLLGKWCEFFGSDDFDKEKFKQEIPKKISIIKNTHHWNDLEKQIKDHEYLKGKIEYLLELISEKLSTIHNVNENKEYWRIVVYLWLAAYVTYIFDRWENIRIFFEKNKTEKFYSNIISLNDSDYVSKNHINFLYIAQQHEWNHLIFLRIFNFLNIKNLSLIKKKITKNNSKKETFPKKQSFSLSIHVIKLIDNMISKFAFKFNKIIFESFYFPKKEYLKICLKCKLIPSRYSNFFDFDIRENSLSKDSKRIEFKNLLLKINTQDKFTQFLLSNIHKDMPKSYLENFDAIKKNFLPFAKKKKIIFSMHSLYNNDNFKIYLAETKKVGSQYIHSPHGGGLPEKIATQTYDLIGKVSDKIITWDNTKQKQNLFINLSPTLPIVTLKKSKIGNYCSIVLATQNKYAKFPQGPFFEQSIDLFKEIVQFVDKLDPEIKSKVKYRIKANRFAKMTSQIFGDKNLDKVSIKNTFMKTILNSKLIIVTHPQTSFSEAMHANIPTILINKKNHWQFSKTALDTLDVLKQNKIAFEDFNEAKIHINKHWKELEAWWKSKNVQLAREMYLTNFFNVKPNWFKEWLDYIYSLD